MELVSQNQKSTSSDHADPTSDSSWLRYETQEDELKKDAGMDYLLKELDAHFEVDTTRSVFLAIEEIEQFTRNESMDVSTYIQEFVRLNNRLKELLNEGEEVYHDAILAYRLLSQAGLNDSQKTLVKAALGRQVLTFANEVEAI